MIVIYLIPTNNLATSIIEYLTTPRVDISSSGSFENRDKDEYRTFPELHKMPFNEYLNKYN